MVDQYAAQEHTRSLDSSEHVTCSQCRPEFQSMQQQHIEYAQCMLQHESLPLSPFMIRKSQQSGTKKPTPVLTQGLASVGVLRDD